MDLPEGAHRTRSAGPAPLCQQRRAKGPHDARNIRTDDLHLRDFLKGAQHRLVVEGSALNHNVPPQFPGVRQLDDLEQSVFDYAVSQAGGNIGNLRPLLLGLLDVGIHEYGAAGPQIDGMFRKQRLPCETGGGIAQGGGEIFNEGTAAGGTGLVEHHGGDGVVAQADALHVLTPDVQHTVHRRVEELCRRGMGDGFHLPVIQAKSGFQQRLAVTRRAGAGDDGRSGHFPAQGINGLHSGADGVALVVCIGGEQQFSFLPDQGQLGGGAPRVDAKKTVSAVCTQLRLFHYGAAVAGAEGVIFLL